MIEIFFLIESWRITRFFVFLWQIITKVACDMALISCPECGKEISDKAFACPHCGNPMNQPTLKHTNNNGSSNGNKKKLLYVLIGLILICIIGGAWFLLRSGNEPAYKEIDISELDSIFSIENIDEAANNVLVDTQADTINDTLYYKIAYHGDVGEQYRLGCRYFESNEENSKNYTKAVKLFRKAAEKGHADAQYHLGLCYDQGIGVPKDKSEAEYWYRKAAKGGNSKAKSKLENINKNEISQKKNDVVKQEKSQVSSSKLESSTSSSRSISSNESSSELPDVIDISIDEATLTTIVDEGRKESRLEISRLQIYRSGLIKSGNDRIMSKLMEFDNAVVKDYLPNMAMLDKSDSREVLGIDATINGIICHLGYYLGSETIITLFCNESESSKLKKIVQLVKQGKFIKK